MLAAAGITSVSVQARPQVTVFSTGDEVVPPGTAALRPGQVRDASAVALAAMVAEAGGEPVMGGIVPDDPEALAAALSAALTGSDLIVISAGPVGGGARRDGWRGGPARAARDMVPRPGDQARQTHAAGRLRRGAG